MLSCGTKDLTLIANDMGRATGPSGEEFFGIAELIHNHQVKRVIATHVGMTPEVGQQHTEGTLEVNLMPQGTLAECIRAGGAGLGGVLTPVGIDTLVEESPFCLGRQTVEGKDYLLMKPIHADFALLGTYECDEFGNCWYKGTMRNFNVVMATAADTVIAECEHLVPVGDHRPREHPYLWHVRRLHRGRREQVMERSEIKGFIAKRCAKELKDGDVVNLGIGLPTMIPNYLPKDVELIIHAELGIVSAGQSPKEGDENYDPYHVVDAGGTPSSVAYGGGFIDSATNFGLIRGGHVDACFLGALEVDAEGNLANWIIPGKKMPGMGGAMDLCVGAKHCIVCMEHTAKGNPKIFEKCRLPLTASHCVNKIITEMCVLEVTDNGLLMTEINPEFTVEQVQAATAAPIKVAENLKSMVD